MNKQEMAMSNETDLDWLARNVHVWGGLCNYATLCDGSCYFHQYLPADVHSFTKSEWLARRAELQNKPSFADHPDAKCFLQLPTGGWFKNKSDATIEVRGEKATVESCGTFEYICQGELIGDWLDTLERRPYFSATNCTVTSSGSFGVTVGETADLSEQAVTARLQEATGNVLAAVPELKSDKYKFDPLTSIEDNHESIMGNKQGMKQDNGWFERGELPPVGCLCLYVVSDRLSAEVEITAHAKFGLCFVMVGTSGESYVSKTAELHRFRPIRTERDVLVEIIASNLSGTCGLVADAIIAAGFKLEVK